MHDTTHRNTSVLTALRNLCTTEEARESLSVFVGLMEEREGGGLEGKKGNGKGKGKGGGMRNGEGEGRKGGNGDAGGRKVGNGNGGGTGEVGRGAGKKGWLEGLIGGRRGRA